MTLPSFGRPFLPFVLLNSRTQDDSKCPKRNIPMLARLKNFSLLPSSQDFE
jgi:hypothetical protein